MNTEQRGQEWRLRLGRPKLLGVQQPGDQAAAPVAGSVQAKKAVADDKLKIAATDLPAASAAATTIQKNFRGHAARKE